MLPSKVSFLFWDEEMTFEKEHTVIGLWGSVFSFLKDCWEAKRVEKLKNKI